MCTGWDAYLCFTYLLNVIDMQLLYGLPAIIYLSLLVIDLRVLIVLWQPRYFANYSVLKLIILSFILFRL